MRPPLQQVLVEIGNLPADALPTLLGELRVLETTAMARLTTSSALARPEPDRLLAIEEAATRLGMSKQYLYRNSAKFAFTRREGGSLRFSSNGIDQHIRGKNSLTSRRLGG